MIRLGFGNKAVGIAAVLSAAFLAACVKNVSVDGPGGQPRGVEGEWISADRVAISRFSGGVFTTTATDTGNKLAEGNYTLTDPSTVQITVVSLIRQTTSNVTCSLASPGQLNCTSSAGQQFVLTRRTPAAA